MLAIGLGLSVIWFMKYAPRNYIPPLFQAQWSALADQVGGESNLYLIYNCCLLAFFLYKCLIDASVYDLNGRRLPGPLTHLHSPSLLPTIKAARRAKKFSQTLRKKIILKHGDGKCAAFNLPFSSFNPWNYFRRTLIFIRDPDMVKTITQGKSASWPKAPRYDRLKPFLGVGLVTSEGDFHKNSRHMLNPSFKFENLKGMIDSFNRQTQFKMAKMTADLLGATPYTPGKSMKINLNQMESEITLAIICETAFGYDIRDIFNIKDEKGDILFKDFVEMSDGVTCVLEEINERLADPTSWWYKFQTERSKPCEDFFHKMKFFCNYLYDWRVDYRKNQQEQTGAVRTNLLDIMLDLMETESNTWIHKDMILDQLVTFFAAGFETTASTLMWTMYSLLGHPEHMAKVVSQVDAIFEHKISDEIDYDDISDMKSGFLEQVVKENLRMYAPIASVARQTVDKETLLGGYRLPKQCNCFIHIESVHYNDKYWDSPDKFRPERFEKENLKNTLKHQYQYLPFSFGQRSCIGQNFANMEMNVILALLLRHYKFSISPEDLKKVRLEETVTYQPRDFIVDVSLREHPREIELPDRLSIDGRGGRVSSSDGDPRDRPSFTSFANPHH